MIRIKTGLVALLFSLIAGLAFQSQASVIIIKPSFKAVTGERNLPSYITSGNDIEVSIRIKIDKFHVPCNLTVRDQFPAGWDAVWSDPAPGSCTPSDEHPCSGELEWQFNNNKATDITIHYAIHVPDGERVGEVKSFSGEIILYPSISEESVFTIGGEKMAEIKNPYQIYDISNDWIIGDFELLDAIDDWAAGNIRDFDLLALIDFWASGIYCWDTLSEGYKAGCEPVINSWDTMSSGSPVSIDHTAIWTGTEMILWGDSGHNRGGKYNPDTDTWNTLSVLNAPLYRTNHTAIWTGSEMIVWGGNSFNDNQNTGGCYDPATDTWRSTSTVNAPIPRRNHIAVWTGKEMIVWGGSYKDGIYNRLTYTGGRYNPASNTWSSMSTANAPADSSYYTAVWADGDMIVWNGKTGGKYNPETDTWKSISIENSPPARNKFTSVWTGKEMIIWGGRAADNTVTNEGGKYTPQTDSWEPVSLSGAPSASYHTAVWSGLEMIIWGTSYGSRYNPATDTWLPVSTLNKPSSRTNYTATWVGTEMIIWGGWDSYFGLAAGKGARYIP